MVQVKNLNIGEGIPKICVPIVAQNTEQIVEQAVELLEMPFDLLELRIDYFDNIDASYIKNAILILKNIISKPVILTFRTAYEGGEREITPEDYKNLLIDIVKTEIVDILDVEMFIGDEIVKNIVAEAHLHGTKVIISNHDFEKTPSEDEIIKRLTKMQKLMCDIAKIAVMPRNMYDVITLLKATLKANEQLGVPIVTMSMSDKGMVSRMAGEVFGSSITFGSGRQASAPGQINVSDLRKVLDIIHAEEN